MDSFGENYLLLYAFREESKNLKRILGIFYHEFSFPAAWHETKVKSEIKGKLKPYAN